MLLYAYKEGSASAKALSQGLGIKRIKHEGSRFKGYNRKTVINWGCSQLPAEVLKCVVINNPQAVAVASNKLSFFKAMAAFNVGQGVGEGDHPEPRVSLPEWTEDSQAAQVWLGNGKSVVVRHKLSGHSGEGIEMLEGDVAVPEAPLYVQYVPKKDEYRIHVLSGEVVDIQRKSRNREVEDAQVNWQVRNHHNGFVFVRGDVAPPQSVLDQAILSVRACGLDFGAVDIIWNDKQKKAYVLECNTAPGLTGSTLDGYVERFKRIMGGM